MVCRRFMGELHNCINANIERDVIANMQRCYWVDMFTKKYKSYDIDMLGWMRLNGTIVAVLIIGKKIRLREFAK